MPDEQQRTTTKHTRRRRRRQSVASVTVTTGATTLAERAASGGDAPTGSQATAYDKQVLAADVNLAGLIAGAPRQTLPFNANVIGMLPWAYLPRRQYGKIDLATLPHDTLEPQQLMELLADASPDVGLALDNTLRLAGADWEYSVRTPDNSDDDPVGKANLDALLARLNPTGGGFEQLLNQWVMSVALQGACCGETIPTPAIDDVADLTAVQPWTIYFQRNLEQALIAFQWQPMLANASAAFLGGGQMGPSSGTGVGSLVVPNPLAKAPQSSALLLENALNHGGFRELNPDTFGYVPLDTFVDDPYGRMPFASVFQVIAFHAQLLKDLRQWSHINAFGRLDISVAAENALKLIPPAVANNAAERLKWLTNYLQTIQSAHNQLNPDDTFVHWDNVTVGSVNSAGETLNIDNLIRAIERWLFRSLRQLPLMMGSNEGTTETWGSIQMEVQALRIQSIQKSVAALATHLLTVALRLRGQTGIVHFAFTKMRSTDRIKDATADMLEAKYAATLRDQGWIDQDEASERVTGSKAVKPGPNPDPLVAPLQPDSASGGTSGAPTPPPPTPGAGGNDGNDTASSTEKEATDGAQDRASQQSQSPFRSPDDASFERASHGDAPREEPHHDAPQDAYRDASHGEPQGDGQQTHGQERRERQEDGRETRHGDPQRGAHRASGAQPGALPVQQLVDSPSTSTLALEAFLRATSQTNTTSRSTEHVHHAAPHPARVAREQALTTAMRGHFEVMATRGVPEEVLRHLAATHSDRAGATSKHLWPPLADAIRKVADAWRPEAGTSRAQTPQFSEDEHAALVSSISRSLSGVYPDQDAALSDTLAAHATATYDAAGQAALDEMKLSGTFKLTNTQTKDAINAAAAATTTGLQSTTRDRVATAMANTLEAGPPPDDSEDESEDDSEEDDDSAGDGGSPSKHGGSDLLVTLLAAAAVACLRHMATGDDSNDGEGRTPRAAIIGATETSAAWNGAKLTTYDRNGVAQKVWVTSGDPDPNAGAAGATPCRDNSYASPIPITAAFPSGDQAPPAHVKCVCDLAAGSDPSALAMAQPWTGD